MSVYANTSKGLQRIAEMLVVRATFKLGPKDKKVIDAFLDGKEMESTKLYSDGDGALSGKWMGGSELARMDSSGRVSLPDMGSKSVQTIQNYIRKKLPKSKVVEAASASDLKTWQKKEAPKVLKYLKENGSMSERDIASDLGYDEAEVSLMLDYLTNKNKVKKFSKSGRGWAKLAMDMWPMEDLLGDAIKPSATTMAGYIDEDTIDKLVQMAAESADLENWRDAGATPELLHMFDAFEDDLEKTFTMWCKKNPMNGHESRDAGDVEEQVEILMEAEGPYLVLMTLRGEGVGIFDGDWGGYYDRNTLKKLGNFLKTKLSKWADDSGGGRLNDALEEAAYETGE